MERRAAASLTASGALVTVLFGLAVGAVGDGFTLEPGPRCLVVAAILLLLAATVCAVVVQMPRYRDEAAADALLERARNERAWQAVEWIGTRRVAEAMANALIANRRINGGKALALRAAYVAQGLAVVALAAALLLVSPAPPDEAAAPSPTPAASPQESGH